MRFVFAKEMLVLRPIQAPLSLPAQSRFPEMETRVAETQFESEINEAEGRASGAALTIQTFEDCVHSSAGTPLPSL
jgi:hypothetical protein